MKKLLSVKRVDKYMYVRNQVKFINKKCDEPFVRKTENRFGKMEEKPCFSGTDYAPV